MGILESIAIADSMAWGAKKYKKALQHTYLHVALRGSIGLAEYGIIVFGFIHVAIDPQFYIVELVNMVYYDEPHRMTAVTMYDFIATEEFKYFAIAMALLYTQDILIHFSWIAGGYSIPKKP